ncbi:hypothetical protein ACKFRL_07750 [Corynebacterium marquesiae]|uniref:hypothetical protein n=1 Tax=Corynebacterium marquesiae TaxID=2913503 RepID=UPI0038D0F590
MNHQEAVQIASQVIAYGSAAAPAQFPKPEDIVVQVWADVLSEINVPPEVWRDAVKLWAAYHAGDRMATPREIVSAARDVVKRWEVDSSKRWPLEAWRWNARVQRAKKIYGSEFALDKVVPPPYWTGIDTSIDPSGVNYLEVARDGWRRAQDQEPEVELPPAEFFSRMKRSLEANRVDRALESGATDKAQDAQIDGQQRR